MMIVAMFLLICVVVLSWILWDEWSRIQQFQHRCRIVESEARRLLNDSELSDRHRHQAMSWLSAINAIRHHRRLLLIPVDADELLRTTEAEIAEVRDSVRFAR